MRNYKELITETLDSDVPFQFSSDTNFEDEFHAIYEVNGNPYISSVIRSKMAGVYKLSVGLHKTKKPKYWKFASPSDILPVMATTLKFLDQDIINNPFTDLGVKGIMMNVKSEKSVADRLQRIVPLLIKRSDLKSKYKLVPVEQPEKSSVFTVFLIHKALKPEAVFNKGFKKYDFTSFENTGELPSELPDDVVPRRKARGSISRKIVSSVLNKSELDLEVSSPEFFDRVENVEPTNMDVFGSIEDLRDPEKLSLYKIMSVVVEDYEAKKLVFELIYGYKPSDKDMAQKSLEDSPEFTSKAFEIAEEFQKMVNKDIPDPISINSEISPLELDVHEDSIKGDATLHFGNNLRSASNPKYFKENLENSLDYLTREILEKTSLRTIDNIMSYTDVGYKAFNSQIKQLFEDYSKGEDIDKISTDVSLVKKIDSIYTVFQEVKPLKEAFWTFRSFNSKNKFNLEDYKPGEYFSQPHFMSTTITKNFAGFRGDVRFMIYIPEGSKVLPLLTPELSQHSNESEILLPPFSTIKIIKTEIYLDKNNKFNPTYLMKGIYLGSAYEDFKDKVGLEKIMMSESTKSLRDLIVEKLSSFGENRPVDNLLKEVYIENMSEEDRKVDKNKPDKTEVIDPETLKNIKKKLEDGELKPENPTKKR